MRLTRSQIPSIVIAALATVTTGGCVLKAGADNPIKLIDPPFDNTHGTLLPAGDYHLVTVRTRPKDDGDVPILCSEPSPDWAIALGTSNSASASLGTSAGASGSLSGSSASTEAITAMVGRTAGVVALRDGLYTACQAYVNKVIGKDAYALILSQFGNLLVSLAGTGGGAGASGTSAASGGSTTTPPAGVAVAVSATPPTTPTTASSTEKPTQATGLDAAQAQVAIMQQQAIQALLVACISENDPSLHPADQKDKNPLLDVAVPVTLSDPTATPSKRDAYCIQVFNDIMQALPNLLKPPQPAPASAGTTAAKPGQTPNIYVEVLQRTLNSMGEHLAVDGVMGPETEAAALRHAKSTPHADERG